MTGPVTRLAEIPPVDIEKNPNNPRRYFNESRLDLLRTSIQEVGVLVPLLVYEKDNAPGRYVLMDGERRWRSSLDLSLDLVPANVIPEPTPLENLLRMFNIHAVREDWPLVSVALSLSEVMRISGEEGEKRLAEMTGLTRSEVRRAKRLLQLPPLELDLIQQEAHLDRSQQVHREDLYLEIDAAESVLRNAFPQIAAEFPRTVIIRQFARKREIGSLRAVTDFRDVGKLVKAAEDGVLTTDLAVGAARRLIQDEKLNPSDLFEEMAADVFRQQALARKVDLLADDLVAIDPGRRLTPDLRRALRRLRDAVSRLVDR
jgi:ParB family chromosome partitioning protein